MSIRSIEHSPQPYARLGGALYLAIILFGAFAEGFVTNKLLVAGDAAATAHRILATPVLWRLSVAANVLVVMGACGAARQQSTRCSPGRARRGNQSFRH